LLNSEEYETLLEQIRATQTIVDIQGKKLAELERAFFEHRNNVSSAHKL